jgi:predicted glycoside hydrolase/deacetylase ChbG (UPF0249 family)
MIDVDQRKICIINADDFGASIGINRGIIEAHTEGVLTSASLMINMPGAEEAVEHSAAHPDLSIGLHVNFTNEGDPVIDITDVKVAKDELSKQYQLFLDLMGRSPTHLDSHHNVHRMPDLLPLFLELAEEQDVYLREHSPVRYFSNFYGQWDDESHPEQISSEQLVNMLETEIRPGITELACHPGYMPGEFVSVYAAEREIELRSLCSNMVKQRVIELNIELMNYSQLRKLLASMAPSRTAS